MKKFLSFLLIACMLLNFTSCTEPVTIANPPQKMTQSDLATILAFNALAEELTMQSIPGEPNTEGPANLLPYKSEKLEMTMYDMQVNMKATSATHFVNTMNASFSTPDNKKHSISQTYSLTMLDEESITINEISCILDGKNLDMSEFLILMKTDICVESYKENLDKTLPFTYQDTKLKSYEENSTNTYNATVEINGQTYAVVLTTSPADTTINGNLLYK